MILDTEGDDQVMSGFYAADGSINISVVDGSTYTGLYAANGSINVVLAPGTGNVGAYAPCGGWWVTVSRVPFLLELLMDRSM